MKSSTNNMIRAATATLSYLLAACAHDMPREGDNATHRVMGKSDVPPISVALPAKNAALPPSVDDLSSIKSLIGNSYTRGNVFPKDLVPEWSIRLKMSTSKSDFLSFDRGGMSFLLNAKRGVKQEESIYRYTITDTVAVPAFGTPTLHTRCGVKPWVIYNTFALISSVDGKTILWAAQPSSTGEKIVVVEQHNFNRLKCSKATLPV